MEGARLLVITDVTFADDITCTIMVQYVAEFIATVERIMLQKRLRLNMTKCELLIVSRTQVPREDISGVRVKAQIKTLGLQYESSGKLALNLESRLAKGKSKVILHASRLKSAHCLDDVDLARVMTKVDVGATMLFGAPMWGSARLATRDPMSHKLQAPYSVLCRRALGLPASAAHWIVAMLAGLTPIQDQVMLAFIRFWGRVLDTSADNELIKAVLRQQQRLCRRKRRCWLRGWVLAFKRLLPDHGFYVEIRNLREVSEESLLRALTQRNEALITSWGDPFSLAPCTHRMIAYTFHVMRRRMVWGKVHKLVQVKMLRCFRSLWYGFLAARAPVPARSWEVIRDREFHERQCAKCGLGEVADERHVLLSCTSTQVHRGTYQSRLRWSLDLPTFMFWNTDREALVWFVVECMDMYDRP